MDPVRLIVVGGYLGAGKTTLLWQAAQRLTARGRRVGLITNDQAPDLVDTSLLAAQGAAVAEVSGSCFCCNFVGLIEAAEGLAHELQADALVLEPVGSCTDLSATILQPLKDRYGGTFRLCPLTVLADPDRLEEVLTGADGRLHPSAAYLYRKQLEEGDVVAINKADLLAPERRGRLTELVRQALPGMPLRCLSAGTGEGVDDWLDAVLSAPAAGQRIAEVDYDTYAEGEAALGWVNAVIRLTAGDRGTDWRELCRRLLTALQEAFRRRRVEVGHVKLLLSAEGGRCVGNLTRTAGEVSIRGAIEGAPRQAEMILNARVEMDPDALVAVVRDALAAAAGDRVTVRVEDLRSLRPARPRPTHRYDQVV